LIDLSIIALNVILFFLFALMGALDFRKKEQRRLWGASVSIIVAETLGFSQRLASVATFIVAFYISMQGMPVSIYAILWVFGADTKGWLPLNYLPLEIIGLIMFFIGGILVIFGWSKIFKAKTTLVTDGIYSYIKHPQYLGILLATLSLVIYRFSPISLILWPVLVIIYYQLAKKEEKIVASKFGEDFLKYQQTVPMFLPFKRSFKQDKSHN
jgi:protein-S-isoprenylcysteine O-methyltransferase Ste14